VIVGTGQLSVDVTSGRPVHQHIVGGLDVKRLFDLGVRSDKEMHQDEGRY